MMSRGFLRTFYLLLMVCGALHGVRAQSISVSLFDDIPLEQIRVEPEGEGWSLFVEGIFMPIPSGHSILFTRKERHVQVAMPSLATVEYTHVAILHDGTDSLACLHVEPVLPTGTQRKYRGNLSLYVDFLRLMCINLVPVEEYVGCVAHAELGPKAPLEAYKAQCLLVRTYLYKHIDKHLSEGFNLCDGVHCQAYHGLREGVEQALLAARSTKGKVLVSATTGELVSTVFHANCGGHTASARDVWLEDNPHLLSVEDPYCVGSKTARWTKNIALGEWEHFLQSKGVQTQSLSPDNYAWLASGRKAHYVVNGVKVPFRDLREFFHLRSAFFSILMRGNRVILKGRGYGHGCGLCQEGAMEMARRGKKAEEIIHFYFQQVRIESYERVVRSPLATPNMANEWGT